MSYMDHNAAFAPVGGIQELSVDEVREVEGGFVPVVGVVTMAVNAARAAAATASACRASTHCMAAAATVAYVADKAVDVVLDEIFD